MIGRTISHYRIVAKLGEGGMGIVYEAEDLKLKRTVALKFLPDQALESEKTKVRFVREARAAAALKHANICTIYEIDEIDGQTFIAMENVEGQSLKEKIATGPLSLSEIVSLTMQIGAGIQEAHEKGIVHRDLKPGNIMLTSKGEAKVLDFGLAMSAEATKMTKTGATMGTLAYMSPEQVRGQLVDHRTDVWSLGVMLYEMVSGRLPFPGENEAAVLYGVIHEDPAPFSLDRPGSPTGSLPEELTWICEKALTKDPVERYQNMSEFLADLQALTEEPTRILARPRKKWFRQRSRRVVAFLATMTAVLLLLIGIGIRFFPGHSDTIHAIAVLPLDNLSSDPDHQFYADGITGELIAKLGQVGTLKVISRTSVKQYKNTSMTLPEIAHELDVDVLVSGTIQLVGDRIRITAELIHAATDNLLWADSFDRDVRDVLALQSDVARAIAQQVLVNLTPEEQALLTTSRQVDPVVYEFYLRGQLDIEEMDWNEASKYFERAIAQDSTFAAAYAGLANAYNLMGQFGWLPAAEAYPKAKTAALRAVELEETLAEAHMALAVVLYQQDWDWDAAEEEFRRAIALNPGSVPTYREYALYLFLTLRDEESIAAAKKGIELDPLNPSNHLILGYVYYYVRRWDEGIAHFEGMLEKWPDHDWAKREMGWCYTATGRYDEAAVLFGELGDPPAWGSGSLLAYGKAGRHEEILAKITEFAETFAHEPSARTAWRLAMFHYAVGELDKSREWLRKAAEELTSEPHGDLSYDLAVLCSFLNNPEQSLNWLEKAYELHAQKMIALKIDPDLDNVRSDPRFTDLMQRVGFPE